jgi:hypothetical protein
MLCRSALSAYAAHSVFPNTQRQRGLLINYESLPGIIPRVVLPLFGVTDMSTHWLHKMGEESSFYSKGRQAVRSFTGDSADKEERATRDIQQYSKLLLAESFEQMEWKAHAGVSNAISAIDTFRATSRGEQISQARSRRREAVDAAAWRPNDELRKQLTAVAVRTQEDIGRVSAYNWKVFAPMPVIESTHASRGKQEAPGDQPGELPPAVAAADQVQQAIPDHSVDKPNSNQVAEALVPTSDYKHSSSFSLIPYAPWAPFANTHASKPFVNVDCPAVPAPGYPQHHPMTTIVTNWNPDHTEIPSVHYDSLCHFDYQNREDNAKAWKYREAEVPFVIYNVPDVDRVVKRWSNVDFLEKKLGEHLYTTETSRDNHFMYHRGPSQKYLRGSVELDNKMYRPPTNTTHVTYERWLENAVKAQNKTLEDRVHEYFRVSSNLDGGNQWLFDELPFFKPRKSLFVKDPEGQQGLHCRFGMRSVISEAHFDGSRNTIAMVSGLRRWIIAHPEQCKNLNLLPRDHPSARHSSVDWSNPDVYNKFPEFKQLKGLEIILQPGDVLYLPTYWIHYIVSLNVNVQCNTRSGSSYENEHVINDCIQKT